MCPIMEEENKERKEIKKPEEEEELQQQVWSWGAGIDWQLGTGKLEGEHLPQLLHVPSLFSSGPIPTLASGGAHVGKVMTWGRGTSGQLGHGELSSSLHPKPITFLDDYVITSVSAGWSHSEFVSDSGCVFTCGNGSFGQLGHGDYKSHSTPFKVSYFGRRRVERIACGMRHSLVLLKDCSGNQVYGFGSGKRGQLGISQDKIKSISLPQITCGFEDIQIVSITANGDHSAAISADGHLYFWGRRLAGTSGIITPQRLVSSLWFVKVVLGWNRALKLTDSTHAVMDRVFSLDGVKIVEIAAGAGHSALLTEDGEVKTWGRGELGQLGSGNTSDQTNPQIVNIGQEAQKQAVIVKVYCGSGFTFAIRSLAL